MDLNARIKWSWVKDDVFPHIGADVLTMSISRVTGNKLVTLDEYTSMDDEAPRFLGDSEYYPVIAWVYPWEIYAV